MSTQPILTTAIAPSLPLHRFTVEHYHKLGEIGVLTPEDKVEPAKERFCGHLRQNSKPLQVESVAR